MPSEHATCCYNVTSCSLSSGPNWSLLFSHLLDCTKLTKNFILFVASMINVIICLTHANVWHSMGKPCTCTQFIKSRIFYYKSHENPYQALQVTRESVSGTTSHVCCLWTCNKIESSYDKIIVTIVSSYTEKKISRVCCCLCCYLCCITKLSVWRRWEVELRPLAPEWCVRWYHAHS